MANVRVLPVEVRNQELLEQGDRVRLRRLSVLFDEVTYRVISLRARLATAATDDAPRLRDELVALEDDWRCLASAHVFAADFARAG